MSYTKLKPPIYDPEAVQPMRDELVYVGFKELTSPELVEKELSLNDDKTTLLMINSVCGCAAGSARPGVTHALQNEIIPDRFSTVFAGQDRDAVDFLRMKYLEKFPPSSPSIALFKNGRVVNMLQRFDIEGKSPAEVAGMLIDIFNKNCSNKGPSIPEEAYAKLVHARACGSKIPLNDVS